MTRLEFPIYLDHIRRESVRFREVLTDVDPNAPVPSCPKWTAGDLLWHLGSVQRFWANVVTSRPAAPNGATDAERPESHDRLLAFFDEWSDRFEGALADADPAAEAWTWAEEQTVGFTYRRQAHEALIHRLDAELAAGTVTALDPLLAADGVDECLDIIFGGTPSWGRFDPLDHYVEFRLTDVDQSVWARLGVFSGTMPDGTEITNEPDLSVVPDPGRPADAVVSGKAGDVDGWLWHRLDDSAIRVTGDREVYARMRLMLEQPIT